VPAPRELLHSLHTGDEEKHQFVLPSNTAGQSTVRGIPLLPKPIPLTQQPFIVVPPIPQLQARAIPASTQSYRKRRDKEEKASPVPTKRYKPREGASKCSKCQLDRTTATGHKQYFGNWYCPATSAETYDEWRTRLAEKNYKKKTEHKVKKKQKNLPFKCIICIYKEPYDLEHSYLLVIVPTTALA